MPLTLCVASSGSWSSNIAILVSRCHYGEGDVLIEARWSPSMKPENLNSEVNPQR